MHMVFSIVVWVFGYKTCFSKYIYIEFMKSPADNIPLMHRLDWCSLVNILQQPSCCNSECHIHLKNVVYYLTF